MPACNQPEPAPSDPADPGLCAKDVGHELTDLQHEATAVCPVNGQYTVAWKDADQG